MVARCFLAHNSAIAPEVGIEALSAVSADDISEIAQSFFCAKNISMALIAAGISETRQKRLMDIINSMDE